MGKIKMKIFASKAGFFLSGIFFIIAMYFVLPMLRTGNTEPGFFLILAAWPISMLAHDVCLVAQNVFDLGYQARNATEVVTTFCFGLAQYYFLGYLIELGFYKIMAMRQAKATDKVLATHKVE